MENICGFVGMPCTALSHNELLEFAKEIRPLIKDQESYQKILNNYLDEDKAFIKQIRRYV